MERIKVLTDNIISLVVPEKQDIEVWYKWINDIETQSFLWTMYWEIITLEDEQDFYEDIRKDKKTKLFSIFVDEYKKIIWNISLWVDFRNRKAELGVVIFDKENRWKWYWTKAINLILKYGFLVLWLNKITLRFFDFNKKAQKVYKKIWFKECWRFKKDYFIWGKYCDVICMEIFRDEFLVE